MDKIRFLEMLEKLISARSTSEEQKKRLQEIFDKANLEYYERTGIKYTPIAINPKRPRRR